MSVAAQIEVETLLEDLSRHSVRISLAPGNNLKLSGKGKPPEELLERLRVVKPLVVEVLRQQVQPPDPAQGHSTEKRPITCAASCYLVEPGKWIHHPWDGCQTTAVNKEPPRRQISQKCWHCGGQRICGCIACGERLSQGDKGECLACRGTGRVWGWIQ